MLMNLARARLLNISSTDGIVLAGMVTSRLISRKSSARRQLPRLLASLVRLEHYHGRHRERSRPGHSVALFHQLRHLDPRDGLLLHGHLIPRDPHCPGRWHEIDGGVEPQASRSQRRQPIHKAPMVLGQDPQDPPSALRLRPPARGSFVAVPVPVGRAARRDLGPACSRVSPRLSGVVSMSAVRAAESSLSLAAHVALGFLSLPLLLLLPALSAMVSARVSSRSLGHWVVLAFRPGSLPCRTPRPSGKLWCWRHRL